MKRAKSRFELLVETAAFSLGPLTVLLCVGATVYADTLLISYKLSNRIVAYSTSGTNMGVFASTGLSSPGGMAIDTSGNVYVANFGNSTVAKYSSTGSNFGVFVSSGMTNPSALAFDSGDNLYVANVNGNNVTEYSPSGTYLGVFANSGMQAPYGLAFDTNGNLYVANNIANNITEYSSSGSSLGTFATGADAPVGIAFDVSGNLYVADQYNHPSIIKYAPDGSASTFANGLSQPTDVHVDSAGNVYVLDAAGMIYEYSSSGSLLKSFPVNAGSFPEFFVIRFTPEAPSLNIILSDNNIVLSWPTSAAGLVLQQNSDLATTNWATVMANPTTTNLQNQVVLSPTNDQNFYRLHSP